MQRKSSKQILLGRYKISPSGIEELGRGIERLDQDRKLELVSISVSTKNSEMKYDNIDELRNDRVWEQRIEKFSLSFQEIREDDGHEPRSIYIIGGTWMDNSILIMGEDEAWVFGTGRLVREKMKKYEVWYKYFVIDWMVKMIYPPVLAVFAAYLTWNQWIGPILTDSSFGVRFGRKISNNVLNY